MTSPAPQPPTTTPAATPRVRHVLFVCTGNTCRSPMAEAIASKLLDEAPFKDRTTVGSAGVSALPGDRVTREAIVALRELHIDPDRPGPRAPTFGSSRALTRELIAAADEIYAMTRAHQRAVLALDPGAAGKVHTLDPDGDIPDPIGHPARIYSETARKLAAVITRRIKELRL